MYETFRNLGVHKIDLVLKQNFLWNLKLTAYHFHFACFRNYKQVFFTSLKQTETFKLFTYHPGHLNIDPGNELTKNALLGTFKQMT